MNNGKKIETAAERLLPGEAFDYLRLYRSETHVELEVALLGRRFLLSIRRG
jgi:hypothetical protein